MVVDVVGALLLPLFTLLAVTFGLAWWLGLRRLQRATGILLVLSAASILVYTGAEVMTLRARVLWHTYMLPVNLALTALLGTVGGIILISRLLPPAFAPMPRRPVITLGLAAATTLACAVLSWALLGQLGADASFPFAASLFASYPAWANGLVASLVTWAVIAAMLNLWRVRHRGAVFQIVLAIAMLASAWMFRWIVFMSVQSVPKYGAGLYLYSMPLGSDGLLGIVGVFGLCAALIAILTFALSLYPQSPFRLLGRMQAAN
ncbi:polysulfide reductase NrfD family protein [Tardiphaga alba]|uniref:hypothetical protein n=1 Tax=Tardiphaga alba TaxID=340268 RepID=UPI002012F4C3|nr:hypothetical protein [Tardiphaga alba]